MKSIRTRRRKPPEGGCIGQAVWRDRWKHRVIPAGAAGGVWNPIGNTRAKIVRRKRGSVMREERNIECMNLRSQRNQMIQTLEAELRQKDKHLHLMAEVAVVMSAVAGIATGALLVLH
jgi:hypothetical protein